MKITEKKQAHVFDTKRDAGNYDALYPLFSGHFLFLMTFDLQSCNLYQFFVLTQKMLQLPEKPKVFFTKPLFQGPRKCIVAGIVPSFF